MEDFEKRLGTIALAPYIVKATALIGVKRKGGSNMFRHQLNTMAILIDYKMVDPVLIKASIIHDLFEDAKGMPGVNEEEIKGIDSDGPAVYELVMEVTRRFVDGEKEQKSDYLQRVMQRGSNRAKRLKLADRISNITALGFVLNMAFVKKYLAETREHILPHAKQVNENMWRELSDLVENRELMLRREEDRVDG